MRPFLRWILYCCTLALAGLLVVISVDEGMAEAVLGWLDHVLQVQHGRLAVAGVAVFLLVIHCLLVMRWMNQRRYAREIGYQNEFGKVAVSLVAIEEALTRAIENEPGVRRVSLRVYEDRVKRCVVIEPVLTLWEDHNVTAINHRCQEVLRSRFAELMPERDQVQVNLTLHRLNQRPANHDKSRRSSTEPSALEPAPLRAPVPSLTHNAPEVPNDRRATVIPEIEPARTQRPTERIHSGRLGVLNERRQSDIDSEEDLDYDSLYAGPTYPVDRDEDDERR
ncbi:MAG: hypothetical protein EA402_01435 [Planctomycetota bacterium]|nr:MAG: hypothetical protein EA402_01435 [Planctomycetota bacterium]